VSSVASRIRTFDQSGGVLGRLWADEHALDLAFDPTSASTTTATIDAPTAAASTSTINSASTVLKMFTDDSTSRALWFGFGLGGEVVVVLSNA
jgi:hypothetical protein